jgi:hypothetical protein
MKIAAVLLALFTVIAALSCGGGSSEDDAATGNDGGGKLQGIEGGPCYPNGTCNAGLSCLSEICVMTPGQDGGTADGNQTGISISGTIKVNGGNPPTATKVLVLNAPLGDSTTTIATVDTNGNSSYSAPLTSSGNYWVYGMYETVGVTDKVRFLGAHAANPVTVTGSVANIDLSVITARAELVSGNAKAGALFLGGETGPLVVRAYAQVYDPASSQPVTNATVEVSDGTDSFPLIYDAGKQGYLFFWGVTPGVGPFTAKVATYTFTIEHTIFGGAATIEIDHHPMTDNPEVVTPAPDTTYPSVQNVDFDWNNASGTVPFWVWVFDTAAPSATPLFEARAEDKTLSKPLTIPAATFSAGKTYELGIYVGRQFTMPKDGSSSIEMSMDFVHVSF